MENNIKKVEPTTRKKDGKPKRLEAQNPQNRLGPQNKGKKEKGPVQWNGLGWDPQRMLKVQDPRDAQHSRSGIKTTLKGCHETQETKGRYVFLKHLVM